MPGKKLFFHGINNDDQPTQLIRELMSYASLAVTMIQEEFATHDTLCWPDILQWIGVAHELETT
jgi:hypothetical protein